MRAIHAAALLTLTLSLGCEPRRPPIPADIGIPMEVAQAGQDAFYRHGCVDCHVIDGIGGKMGPSLAGIGATQDAAYIKAWIVDPQGVRRSSSMPRLPLTPQEVEAVTSWLAAHR